MSHDLSANGAMSHVADEVDADASFEPGEELAEVSSGEVDTLE
ncbi:unannotated protein [freshwater metagenome]|uniref:Unannotated protein n=1 Tax=freshwater metagenome TaxID=449393 RepID=A0A6J5YG59_9ZZZZ